MTADGRSTPDDESALVRKVLDLLSASGADYQVLHHEPVFTSEQAASVRGTPLEDGAKALVCHADDRMVLIVVPANLRLDTRGFKSAYAVKNLRMAAATDVEALGAVVGGVPPFGQAMGLTTYADECVAARMTLSFNAGSRTTSVIVAAQDYLRIEQPIIGRFAG
jgi:prolyl-tRNA editing enzyme YbaK/EbsC (Cys-tRNA(Pro) deacylase)